MYADIGPMSRQQRSNVPDYQLDDNRVEYAQLTVHADKDFKLQNINPQLIQEFTSPGNNYHNI